MKLKSNDIRISAESFCIENVFSQCILEQVERQLDPCILVPKDWYSNRVFCRLRATKPNMPQPVLQMRRDPTRANHHCRIGVWGTLSQACSGLFAMSS